VAMTVGPGKGGDDDANWSHDQHPRWVDVMLVLLINLPDHDSGGDHCAAGVTRSGTRCARPSRKTSRSR